MIVLPLWLAACGSGDPFERHPGWIEGWEEEETHGRLSAREYIRHGLGEGDTSVFNILLFDGEPVEITGGHIRHVSFCDTCGDGAGDAVAALLLHRDEEQRGLVVFQVVGDSLKQTRLCPETGGLEAWRGARYEEDRCRWAYYDAELHEIVDLRAQYPTIPRLPLPEISLDEREQIGHALDLLKDWSVTWLSYPQSGVGNDLPDEVQAILPLGAVLTPFVVERLTPVGSDETYWLLTILERLKDPAARLPVAVLRAHLKDDIPSGLSASASNRVLGEIGGWP